MGVHPFSWNSPSSDHTGRVPSIRVSGIFRLLLLQLLMPLQACLGSETGENERKKIKTKTKQKTEFPPVFIVLRIPLPTSPARIGGIVLGLSLSTPGSLFWIWGCFESKLGNLGGKIGNWLPAQWNFEFWSSSPVYLLLCIFHSPEIAAPHIVSRYYSSIQGRVYLLR